MNGRGGVAGRLSVKLGIDYGDGGGNAKRTIPLELPANPQG